MNHLFDIHHKKNFLVHILLILITVIVPFYSIRIPILHTSLSILTLSCLTFNLVLLFLYPKSIRDFFHTDPLWIYTLLLLGAFLPTVYVHPHMHAIGVYVEWFIVPIVTGFLLSQHLSRKPRDIFLLICGIVASAIIVLIDAGSQLIYGVFTFDHRLTAHYLSPNHLALYIAPMLFLFATFYSHKNRIVHVSTNMSLIISLIVLFYTHSLNTAFAIFLTTIIVACALIKKRLQLILFLGSIIFALCFIGYHKIRISNSDIAHSSLASRIAIWRSSVFLMQTEPFYGYEIDSFQSHYLLVQKFFPPYPDWAVPTPHNLALTLLFSGGFFTLLFFVIIVFRIFYVVFTSYCRDKDPRILFYGAAFFTIVLCGFADTPYWKNDLSLIFWFIAAAILSQSSALPHPSHAQHQ